MMHNTHHSVRRTVYAAATAVIYWLSLGLTDASARALHISSLPLSRATSMQAMLTEFLPFIIACCAAIVLSRQVLWFQRVPTRITLTCLIAAAAAVWLTVQPVAYSLDSFRYLWNGHLLLQHVSPYTYVPNSPHLDAYKNWPLWGLVGWRDWPEAYPPLAQLYFVVAAIFGDGQTMPLKLMLLGNQGVILWLFYKVLKARRLQRSGERQLTARDVQAFTMLALFPPVLLELLGAEHVDAFVVPWLLAAWLWALKKQPGRLGFALAAATALKIYPLVLLPAFLTSRTKPFAAKMLVVFGVTLLFMYLPFVTPKLEVVAYFAYSANYFAGSALQWWMHPLLTHVPHGSTLLMAILELLVWFFVLFTKASKYTIEQKVCILGFTFLLATPMMHPWYTIPLVPFAILAVDYAILWFTLLVHLTYSLFQQGNLFLAFEYIPTYLIAVYQWTIKYGRHWLGNNVD